MRMLFVSYHYVDNGGPGWGRCQIPCYEFEPVTMDMIESIEKFLRESRNYIWVGIMFWQWFESPGKEQK